MNVPPTIGTILSRSSEPATTLLRLATVLSLEDLHDLIEVQLVDQHNQRVVDRIEEERRRNAERDR